MTHCHPHAPAVSELTLLASLFTHAHVDLDGRALKAKGLTEPAGDKAAVARIQEAGGEQHELRRAAGRLGAEEDAGLLSAADRVGVRCYKFTQESVEPAGRDALVPVPGPGPVPAPGGPYASPSAPRY